MIRIIPKRKKRRNGSHSNKLVPIDMVDIYMGMPLGIIWQTPDYIPSFIPSVIYLITKNGIIEEWRRSMRLKICRQIERESSYLVEPNDYLFYNNSVPVYVGNWDGATISPFTLPDHNDIKLTSISLYAKVVTFPKTVTRLIARRLKDKDDNNNGRSIFYWMIAVLFAVLMIIFLLIVTITSDDKVTEVPTYPASSYPAVTETIQQPSHEPDLTIPVVIPPPVNYAQPSFPSDAAKGVPIE